MKTLISLAIVSTLAACANTGVVQMGPGTYLISKDSAKVGGGISQAVRVEVYQEAGAFCSRTGRYVKTEDLLMQPGMPGRLGNVTLQFTCTDSTASNAVRLQREADRVIEIRQR